MSTDWTPTRKVGTAGVTGALSIVLVWALGRFHVDMPDEVAAAITLLIMFGASYLTPPKPAE